MTADYWQRGANGGYWFTFDGWTYSRWADGRPFTLPEIWRDVRGVAGVTIYAPTGRVVLENAGSLAARRQHVDRARKRRRGIRFP